MVDVEGPTTKVKPTGTADGLSVCLGEEGGVQRFCPKQLQGWGWHLR
jgi:hypothetical protein